MPIRPVPRPRSAPAREGDAGGPDRTGSVAGEPPRTLLLLAAEGDPWSQAAIRAADAAGLCVHRFIAPGQLLRALEENDERSAAVLVVGRALPADERRPWTARLGDRTAGAGLPLFVVEDHGMRELSDNGAFADLPHVTLFTSPPTERVLTTVLRAARREQERREHICDLLHRLEEAGKREERLLAQVGHELRNPLGAITSALTLMRELGPEESPTRCYRRLIERQVEALTRAVDEMLEVTGDRVTHLSQAGNGNGGHAGDGVEHGDGAGTGDPSAALSVLLVEDDADGRQALSELLRTWGHTVRVAADGETAVEVANRHAPEVALVDIGLPGIDGYAVARRIRREHPRPPPLLVAMTGYGQPEDRDRALEAGFDLHLVKPIRPALLAQLLGEQRGDS